MIDSGSDAVLLTSFIVGLIFSASFALGRPRAWFRDRLGWVIFLYSLAVDALLFLIVWAIVFGQKIGEEYRLLIAVALLGTLIAKIWIVHLERAEGRERARLRAEEPSDTLSSEEGKS